MICSVQIPWCAAHKQDYLAIKGALSEAHWRSLRASDFGLLYGVYAGLSPHYGSPNYKLENVQRRHNRPVASELYCDIFPQILSVNK